MGACDFKHSGRGNTMSEAYRNSVKDAQNEYGNDAYNGTISTTNGYVDKTLSFESSKLSIDEFIDKNLDSCRKWGEAWGICVEKPVGNEMKVKSQVNHVVTKGTKKWVLKYVVYVNFDETLTKKDNKGDAVKAAREYTEKTGKSTIIRMEKMLETGDNIVARIEYKKSNKEKIGKYVFFGLAAD